MADLLPVFVMLVVLFGLIALGVPIAFALIGASLWPLLTEDRLSLFLVAQRTYNSLDSFLLLAVPFFLLAGALMNETGITARLVRFAAALVGHLRGGLAQINVFVSILFSGISGSSLADTAATGMLLIPEMKRKGFPAEFSAAITAASSVMGVIIPPSLLLIVWGGVTGTSIGALFVGGIIPGLMLGGGLMIAVNILARRRDFPLERRNSTGEIGRSAREAAIALMMPVLIVGGIRFGFFTPTEASIVAVLYALFLGLVVYRTLSLKNLMRVLYESGRTVSLAMLCVGAAGVFGFLLAYYHVPRLISGVTLLIDNPSLLLIAIALLMLVLGTFLDGLVVAIICGPLFLPATQQLGIDPVHYGLVSCIAIAIGVVTPPYGLCLLLASKIAEVPMSKTLPDTARLIGTMLLVLLIVILVPPLTTLSF